MKEIIYFVKKEFQQFKRDPKMFMLILIAPIIQITFLGYAANLDVDNVKITILDYDKSALTRSIIYQLENSSYFTVSDIVENYNEGTEKLENGETTVLLVFPPKFKKNILSNKKASIQAIFDGSDGNKANIASGYLNSFFQLFLKRNVINNQNFKINSKIINEERVWYNQELKTRKFMVPGIAGLLLTLITLILTSLAIVKEKEVGTFEQLMVTPLKPYQIILGKLIPFALLGFISVIIVLLAMNIIFGISVRGDLIFLLLSAIAFLLSTLGLGLFISTIATSQQQAMMLSVFGVMMPMTFLSGFAFPIENMPKVIQGITTIIPLKYFMRILRGVILKGVGFEQLWSDFAVLILMGVIILTVSALKFNRRLN